MAFPPNVWKQIKNLTKDDVISAMLRDGWEQDPASRDATIAYIKHGTPKNRRVVIHYHSKQVCGPKLIKGLLEDLGWNEADLRRLKIIK